MPDWSWTPPSPTSAKRLSAHACLVTSSVWRICESYFLSTSLRPLMPPLSLQKSTNACTDSSTPIVGTGTRSFFRSEITPMRISVSVTPGVSVGAAPFGLLGRARVVERADLRPVVGRRRAAARSRVSGAAAGAAPLGGNRTRCARVHPRTARGDEHEEGEDGDRALHGTPWLTDRPSVTGVTFQI